MEALKSVMVSLMWDQWWHGTGSDSTPCGGGVFSRGFEVTVWPFQTS